MDKYCQKSLSKKFSYPVKFNPEIHHRRSIRLKEYDYSKNGAYFVTICSWNRELIFGENIAGNIHLNDWGLIVDATWSWLESQYPFLESVKHVIMPNHLHGILLINRPMGGSRTAPTQRIKPLGQILGAFKTRSTKLINESRKLPGTQIWQRNYYERIIRNKSELDRISDYIVSNPVDWINDENNPVNFNVRDLTF
jgi:putative transposase